MSDIRKIGGNVLFLIFSEIVTRVFSFLALVYLARVLGTKGFGSISFAQATMAYVLLFSHMGLTIFGSRETARERDNLEHYISNIISIRLVVSCIALILLSTVVMYVDCSSAMKFLIIAYSSTALVTALTLDWLFVGLEKIAYVGIFRIINSIAYAALIFVVVEGVVQLYYVPIIFFVSQLFGVSFLLYKMHALLGIRLRLSTDLHIWKVFLSQALPMGVALMLAQFYFNFDTILLGVYHGETIVGYYSAAYKIVVVLIHVIVLYNQTIFPLLSRFYKESREKLGDLVGNSVRWSALFSIPIGLGGTLLAPKLIVLIFGTTYLGSIVPFQILIWSFVILAVSKIYGNAILACNRQDKHLKAVSIGLGVNMALNFALIPRYGMLGASIATVAAEFSVLWFLYFQFQKLRRVQIGSFLAKPFIAGGVMCFLLMVMQGINILLLVALGAISYVAVLVLIRGFTIDEISFMRSKLLAGNRHG